MVQHCSRIISFNLGVAIILNGVLMVYFVHGQQRGPYRRTMACSAQRNVSIACDPPLIVSIDRIFYGQSEAACLQKCCEGPGDCGMLLTRTSNDSSPNYRRIADDCSGQSRCSSLFRPITVRLPECSSGRPNYVTVVYGCVMSRSEIEIDDIAETTTLSVTKASSATTTIPTTYTRYGITATILKTSSTKTLISESYTSESTTSLAALHTPNSITSLAAFQSSEMTTLNSTDRGARTMVLSNVTNLIISFTANSSSAYSERTDSQTEQFVASHDRNSSPSSNRFIFTVAVSCIAGLVILAGIVTLVVIIGATRKKALRGRRRSVTY